MHTAPVDAVVLCSDRTLEAKANLLPFPQGMTEFSGSTRFSPSPSSSRNISTFTVSVTPPEAKLLRLLFLVFASKGNLCFTAFGFSQNTQINLFTCRNSELMAGSQYPETTRSFVKSGLLLFIELLLFLFSR